MFLNLANEPEQLREKQVTPGDIYMSQKGQYWLIVAEKNGRASIVVFDHTGLPTAVQTYGTAYIASNKQRVGTAVLPTLDVEWED